MFEKRESIKPEYFTCLWRNGLASRAKFILRNQYSPSFLYLLWIFLCAKQMFKLNKTKHFPGFL